MCLFPNVLCQQLLFLLLPCCNIEESGMLTGHFQYCNCYVSNYYMAATTTVTIVMYTNLIKWQKPIIHVVKHAGTDNRCKITIGRLFHQPIPKLKFLQNNNTVIH